MKRFIAFVILIAAGLFIQSGYINEYPSHIHAWAEQDHYALALGFIDNHFDFLHPQTNIYNKQFPGWWKEAYDTTVTAADCPIHEYCAALLMKLFHRTSPWVFRLWTWLWGILGLFYLFKIGFKLTQDWAKALLVAFIALTSPVFAYYLNGFLPGIPAFALSAIGLWCYLCYLDNNSKHRFRLSVVFFTLAMLIRTTFAIGLIAMLCYEMLRIFRKESTFLDKLPVVILSFTAFLASYLWNRQLRLTYGSIFLSSLLPAESLQDAKELLVEAWRNWGTQYFQPLHYWIIIILVISGFLISRFKDLKISRFKDSNTGKRPLSLWWLPLIQVFGCLLFTIAMMQQIQYHDYYFIDTLFLPLLVLVTLVLRALPKPRHLLVRGAEYAVLAVLCVMMVHNVVNTQKTRRAMENYALISYNNFKDSDLLLDDLGMARDAKVLCLYGYAQNGPFIQMGRKGYIVMEDNDELLEAAMQWDMDCIVIENEKYANYFEKRKELFSGLKKIGGNDKISVFLPPVSDN